MADDVIEAAAPTAPAEPFGRPQPEPTRADRARHSAYRSRFVLIYFALAIVLGSAVGALAITLRSSSSSKAKPQAPVFNPSANGEIAAMALAANVQRRYRTADGKALVDVIASRNTLQNGDLGYLRVRFQVVQPLDAQNGRDSQVLRTNDAIQYSLCGTGAQCAIAGTPTPAHAGLLQREALELALRTLGNDAHVDNVSVFIRPVPPPQGSSFEGYVYVFNRGLITKNDPSLLSQPLQETLPGAGSTLTPAQMDQDQILRIEELTRPYLYLFRYQVIGGRDAAIDLQPGS